MKERFYIYTYISYCSSSEMIHRGDAQMNSYRYDRTTSAEDTPEMHRSLLVCTGLMVSCRVQGVRENRKQIWAFQVQPFNHIRNLGQRVHEHLLPGVHRGGRGFQ